MSCDADRTRCVCPTSEVVDLLARRYAMQIVCVVGAHGVARFSLVEEHLPGASTSTLSNRLSELADAGVVAREQYDEIPPRVEYELTESGEELRERLLPLMEWADGRS